MRWRGSLSNRNKVITSFITRYKTKAEMSMTSAIPFIFLVG
jgi:hypothetical protein